MKKLVYTFLGLFLVLSTTAQAKMVFRQGNGSEPQTVDPHIMTGHTEMHLIMALFEPLVGYDPKTLKPVPGVAKSWEVSEDALTYTFHLQENAKWSNGDKLTAKDFIYSWNRYLHPELGSEYAYMLYPLKNAESYNTGKIKDFNQVGVKAKDDHTLVVTLERPTPYFIGIMQFPGTTPIHKATIEKFGGMTERNSKWVRPENIVSNGPFQMKSWVMNDKIVLTKNPNYWDKANVKLDEVEVYPIDNILSEEKMFRSGKLHKTYELPNSKIATYQSKYPDSLLLAPFLATYYFWINTTEKPFLNNTDLRKALAYSIDREAIVKYVSKAGEIPAYTLVPEGTGENYKTKLGPTYDIAKAKEFLAKAGYPDGKGLPAIDLLYNTSENHKKIAEVVQQMWKKNLGIQVNLVNEDWKVYLDSLKTQNFQMARGGWIGDYNDPNTFFDMFMSDNGNNKAGYKNPEYDKIITESQKTLDPVKRYELFHKADQILREDMPFVPVYFYSRPSAISPKVKGWYSTILDLHPLKNVYLEE